MSLRFHEIAEAGHRILNPFSEEKLRLVGEICAPDRGSEQLDLGCGRGELLCQWATQYGTRGTGIDISEVFLGSARARAEEIGVAERLSFVHGDAGKLLRGCEEHYDIVSCLGVTWIGGGLSGSLELMKPVMRGPDTLLVVGEPFWIEDPPTAAWEELAGSRDLFASLPGTLERFESSELELLEMVLASQDDFDRYEASQWKNVSNWLRSHPEDPDAPELAAWLQKNRRRYLEHGRRYLGWGVFVLRAG